MKAGDCLSSAAPYAWSNRSQAVLSFCVLRV
jgi:hypothetical protein